MIIRAVGCISVFVFVLFCILVHSIVHHICCGGHERKKHYVDKDSLDGHYNDGLQINKNRIWKKTCEVDDNDVKTIVILTEYEGLKIKH